MQIDHMASFPVPHSLEPRVQPFDGDHVHFREGYSPQRRSAQVVDMGSAEVVDMGSAGADTGSAVEDTHILLKGRRQVSVGCAWDGLHLEDMDGTVDWR